MVDCEDVYLPSGGVWQSISHEAKENKELLRIL